MQPGSYLRSVVARFQRPFGNPTSMDRLPCNVFPLMGVLARVSFTDLARRLGTVVDRGYPVQMAGWLGGWWLVRSGVPAAHRGIPVDSGTNSGTFVASIQRSHHPRMNKSNSAKGQRAQEKHMPGLLTVQHCDCDCLCLQVGSWQCSRHRERTHSTVRQCEGTMTCCIGMRHHYCGTTAGSYSQKARGGRNTS